MNHDDSRDLYDRALSVLAGGVNSSVRASMPYPFFVEHGDGAHVIDADGNRYLDYVMGYGPLLFGHDLPDPVQAAVQSHVSAGPMYGAPTEVEVDLAEFVARHVPSIEMLRFVNSGTEATVSAVRLARAYTGRDKIVVMQGGYHGAQESTLVEGEPGSVHPSSPGIPDSFADHTIPVPFNDPDTVTDVFEAHGDDIAAVLTLTTLGKIVGGGFPVGAIGGRAEIVEHLTPGGDVFQSGTFSGHPVTMAAGLETLRYAAENDVYDHVNALGEQLRAGITDILEERAPRYTVVGTGSIFKTIFTRAGQGGTDRCAAGCRQRTDCPNYDACPKTGADVAAAETNRWERVFWQEMRERGVFLTANQFEAQFVSYAHTEADIERTLDAYQEAL